MGLSNVTYNGYQFPDRAHISCTEEFVYDDAGWTIKYTRFKLRVECVIVNETPQQTLYDDVGLYCGSEMMTLSQRLSKVGEELYLEHDGFWSRPHLRIGGSQGNPIRDVAMGPSPKMLSWNPVGHTNACEVVWECEFCLPVCDGVTGSPAFRGLSAFNYSIAYDIDKRGYTTRRISGSLEIAMQRNGRNVTDTVEEYRSLVIIKKPDNFERNVTWTVSADRRRAEFTITDAEIPSATNVYPNGVVSIQATHRVNWNKRSRAYLGNSISAAIELAADQPRYKAWEVFRDIVNKRRSYAAVLGLYVMLESVDVSEELYENKISFNATYRISGPLDYKQNPTPTISIFFSASGLLQPLEIIDQYNPNGRTWKDWSDSIRKLQPFQGGDLNANFGLAGLKQSASEDRIVDLCSNQPPQSSGNVNPIRPGIGYVVQGICNPAPTEEQSWLRFEAQLEYRENATDSVSVTLGPDDLSNVNFNPRSPDAPLPQYANGEIKRFFESYAGINEFIWSGKAERVGYPIPVPGNLKIGGRLLVPVKNGGSFKTWCTGESLCQPVYQAVWRQRYRFYQNPEKLNPKDATPT